MGSTLQCFSAKGLVLVIRLLVFSYVDGFCQINRSTDESMVKVYICVPQPQHLVASAVGWNASQWTGCAMCVPNSDSCQTFSIDPPIRIGQFSIDPPIKIAQFSIDSPIRNGQSATCVLWTQ